MTPEPNVFDKEPYAMPVHEVIAILRSSSDDRAFTALGGHVRRAGRCRILAELAPEPDLVVLAPTR